MFKVASSADEIYEGMRQNELKMAYAEESEQDIKYLRAIQELTKAAELYEVSGEIKKAEVVTNLIEAIATRKQVDEEEVFKHYGFIKKKDKKKSKKKSKAAQNCILCQEAPGSKAHVVDDKIVCTDCWDALVSEHYANLFEPKDLEEVEGRPETPKLTQWVEQWRPQAEQWAGVKEKKVPETLEDVMRKKPDSYGAALRMFMMTDEFKNLPDEQKRAMITGEWEADPYDYSDYYYLSPEDPRRKGHPPWGAEGESPFTEEEQEELLKMLNL